MKAMVSDFEACTLHSSETVSGRSRFPIDDCGCFRKTLRESPDKAAFLRSLSDNQWRILGMDIENGYVTEDLDVIDSVARTMFNESQSLRYIVPYSSWRYAAETVPRLLDNEFRVFVDFVLAQCFSYEVLGIVFSEALRRNVTAEIVRETAASILDRSIKPGIMLEVAVKQLGSLDSETAQNAHRYLSAMLSILEAASEHEILRGEDEVSIARTRISRIRDLIST